MNCPHCGSPLTKTRESWVCAVHGATQEPSLKEVPSAPPASGTRLFLSYGRRDAKELAERLRADLERRGYEVWVDTREIRAGRSWEDEIVNGLRSTQVIIALLSPHAVRRSSDSENPDDMDSVCLDEISFARFSRPPKPIVPVMAEACEPPFCIFRLDYVDMCTWRDQEEHYQAGVQRVLDAVESALQGKTQYRWWEPKLKPWDFTAFIFEKRQHFCGREWLFEEIDAWRSSSAGRTLLITGDPGIGKSAVVAQLVHLNPGGQVLAYHCCQGATKATLDPALFVRSIAAMIASKLDVYADMLHDPAVEDALRHDNCAADPGSAFERGVLTPLEHLPAPDSGTRYILIDALDEALLRPDQASTIVDVLASRLERLPHWLRIVATSRKDREVLARLAGLHAKSISTHDPRNLEDIRKYIQIRLSSPDVKSRLDASAQSADSVLPVLLKRSDGSFLYVQQVLEGIERDMYRFDDMGELPPGLGGLYLRDLSTRFADETVYAPVRRVLEVLVASQGPLTEDMLSRSTGISPEEELPTLLRSLSGYFRETHAPSGESRYSIYHQSFADWLTDSGRRGSLYGINEKRGQEQLAQACWEEYKRGARELSPYALEHLPTHLAEVGRFHDVLEVVQHTRLGFIRRWVEEGKGETGLMCLGSLIQFLESHGRHATTCAGLATQLARIHSLRGEYDKARDWLQYAIRRTAWWRGRRARSVALHETGSLLLYEMNFSEARRFYRHALRLSLWGRPVYHDEAAANLIGLATVSDAKSLFSSSIRFATRGIREAKQAGDFQHFVSGKRTVASALKSIGRYDEAEEHIQGALLICEVHGVPIEKARLLLLMGWLKHDQATLRRETSGEAIDMFHKALAATRQVPDLFCAVEAEVSLCWQALSAQDASNTRLHLATLRRALSPQLHPQLRAGIRVASAAEVHQGGNPEEAKRLYEESISFCAAHHCNAWKRRAMIGRGSTLWRMGNRDEADKVWDEVLELARQSSEAKRALAEASIGICRSDPLAAPG